MAIKQYSLETDGAKQLAPGFRVREFRCRDGTDTILIDEGLVVVLQWHPGALRQAGDHHQRLPHRQPQRKGGWL